MERKGEKEGERDGERKGERKGETGRKKGRERGREKGRERERERERKGEREREREREREKPPRARHSPPQSSNIFIGLACSPASLEKPQGTSAEGRVHLPNMLPQLKYSSVAFVF